MKPVKHFSVALLMLLFTSITSAMADVEYRLPSHIEPTFQRIELTADPDKPDYSGNTQLDLNITKSTKKVGFYQRGLTITRAVLVSGSTTIPLTVTEGDYDINWATAESTIPAGKYRLSLEFNGLVNTKSDGMYLSAFEGNNYIFTQFEDMYARRAFPSFDEPSFKIPYQLTINAPEKHTVLSNTPVESRSVNKGIQRVTFKKTKPMPTYIVAYAIGEMDSREITGLSVPGKIYTPKGHANKTKFVAKHTPGILTALEDYFGSKYPYEKLDFIAVPNFTFGAMENAGLVTYRSELLLLDDEPGLTEQRGPLNVVAHELAHQWYGNLVTMAWWDDLWLNEAFASWMASKVMGQLYPEQNFAARLVQEGAFPADASPTTKPIKKLVRTQPEVMDGLGLNYSKGESILQMIEALVGQDAFQKGVQSYMQKHQWSNTEADDLWKVLSSVSDIDVPAMMKTYLEQAGYPLIEFADNGRVTQTRYHLAGAKVKEQVWTVPLPITYKVNGKLERTLVFLDDQETLVGPLAEADWIYPNANAMGYFRWKVPAKKLFALLEDLGELNNREKNNILNNSNALLLAGELTMADHMSVLNALAEDNDPQIARTVMRSLGSLTYLVDDNNEANFTAFVEAKLLPWFERLGVTPEGNESDDVIRLRQAVFAFLGRYSKSDQVLKTSEELASEFLKDSSSVSRGMAAGALRAISRNGSTDWFAKVQKAYVENTDGNVRNTLLSGMRFPQPNNVKTVLDFALQDSVNPANVIRVVATAAAANNDQTAFYEWMNENFDALSQKMPSFHLSRMPEFVSNSCFTDNIALAKAFYEPRMAKFDGMQRSFDVAMARANQCVELKERNQTTFNQFLSNAK
ncbi:M1 family peptidase [Alteromonadaceae bacterium M269]|nr:M1 family peptidase [Alteromonadaceae bacterium M269]